MDKLDKLLKSLGIPELRTLDDYNLILLSSAALGVFLDRRRFGSKRDITLKALGDGAAGMVLYLREHNPPPDPLDYPSKEIEGV